MIVWCERFLMRGLYTNHDPPVTVKTEPPDEIQDGSDAKTIGEHEKVPLVIMPYGERYSILRQLEQMKPTVIILYNTDIVTLRQIEVYFCHTDNLESTEESRYLTALKNETDAFESLFKEKAVIVDMREFNSELPTVLYTKGYDVVAVTLEVGDYVLSPGIAVERKALDDLTQSLQSGRVFKQSEQMLRHYANSVLLVESNRKFESKIVNGGPFQGELTRHCREVRALLCSLLRATPRLKLIWSLSPANSAEYFAELKVRSLRDLFTMPIEQLHTAVGSHADKLHVFANFDFSASD
ncbi:ERCC4 domain protein [Ostertagia ostertagi]